MNTFDEDEGELENDLTTVDDEQRGYHVPKTQADEGTHTYIYIYNTTQQLTQSSHFLKEKLAVSCEIRTHNTCIVHIDHFPFL